MVAIPRRHLVLRVAGFWFGFLALHYAYDLMPILPFRLISGVDESFFQHQKIAFYTYVIVCGIEYLVRRKRITDLSRFFHSRLFATLFVPWLVFLIWYIAPAYVGRLPTIFLEILYSNVAVVIVALCALLIERHMEQVTYSRAFSVLLLALFVISVSFFTIFTFRLPWIDVFADPYLPGG